MYSGHLPSLFEFETGLRYNSCISMLQEMKRRGGKLETESEKALPKLFNDLGLSYHETPKSILNNKGFPKNSTIYIRSNILNTGYKCKREENNKSRILLDQTSEITASSAQIVGFKEKPTLNRPVGANKHKYNKLISLLLKKRTFTVLKVGENDIAFINPLSEKEDK